MFRLDRHAYQTNTRTLNNISKMHKELIQKIKTSYLHKQEN